MSKLSYDEQIWRYSMIVDKEGRVTFPDKSYSPEEIRMVLLEIEKILLDKSALFKKKIIN